MANENSDYEALYLCNCLGITCDCPEGNLDIVGSTLAIALDIAVACSATFEADYFRIYGIAWEPLCRNLPRKSYAETTTAKTINR